MQAATHCNMLVCACAVWCRSFCIAMIIVQYYILSELDELQYAGLRVFYICIQTVSLALSSLINTLLRAVFPRLHTNTYTIQDY